MTLNQGQVIQSRYRMVTLLGKGGFGAVYRGWDLNLNKPVAIKENLDTSTEAQRQFQHEAQILSNLSHPNLPRVTDHFLIAGMGQYLVMDYVEGEDLQTMLEQRGRLPESQVLPWMEQVFDALAYLHTRTPPIIHRDIKPANIKITPQGQAVLVDFGISKIYDAHLKTTVGARAVTPGFSPPEQYGQGTTDARSDIYALGATMYVLLTGQEPPESVILLASGVALTPPHLIAPGINPRVEAAILRACEPITTHRLQSVNEFRQALKAQPFIATPPIQQPPMTMPPIPQAVPTPAPVARPATPPISTPQPQPLPTPQPQPHSYVQPAPARAGFGTWLAWAAMTGIAYAIGAEVTNQLMNSASSGSDVRNGIAGAVLGGIVGLGQWLVLRKYRPGAWILLSAIGGGLGFYVLGATWFLEAVSGFVKDIPYEIVLGAVVGSAFGLMQSIGSRILRGHAAAWMLISAIGGVISWLVVLSTVHSSSSNQLIMMWAELGAIQGAITGLAMVRYLRRA
jgi:serine/threonine protein kinase